MLEAPYHDRDGWIWMNGDWTPWRDAKLHVLTHGLHYGSCVFEGERAYGGQIFKSAEHTARLRRSANILGFDLPYTDEEISAIKQEALLRNDLPNAYVRAFAWRGSEKMGVSAPNNMINVAVASWFWGDYFSDKMAGIKLIDAPWRRPDPATAPHDAKAAGLYMICTLSKHAAEAKGYQDALMLDWQGRVAEATGANIFLVRDGAIHTPIADCFLNGITRQTVIALARQRGIEVIERRILPDELPTFSEIFLTGSAAEVTPVSEIAGRMYQPGRFSEQMMQDYANFVRGRPV